MARTSKITKSINSVWEKQDSKFWTEKKMRHLKNICSWNQTQQTVKTKQRIHNFTNHQNLWKLHSVRLTIQVYVLLTLLSSSRVKHPKIMSSSSLSYRSRGPGDLLLLQGSVGMRPPAHLLSLVVRSQQVWEVEILEWGRSRRQMNSLPQMIFKPLLRLTQQQRGKVRAWGVPRLRTMGNGRGRLYMWKVREIWKQ